MTPLLLLLLSCARSVGFETVTVEAAADPWKPGTCAQRTELLWSEPSPEPASAKHLPTDFKRTPFPVGDAEFQGWLALPAGTTTEAPAKVLVFLHAGLSINGKDFEPVAPWVDKGWAVFVPTWRAEMRNPGAYQLMCGEVDDIAAAIRWIATHPKIDSKRIEVFGHGTGGGIAALLALEPDLPVARTGSLGGLYFQEMVAGWGPMLPFDRSKPTEIHDRILLAHLDDMQRPHVAYLGTEDPTAIVIPHARAAAGDAPLTIHPIEGGHLTATDRALEAFLADAPEPTPEPATPPADTEGEATEADADGEATEAPSPEPAAP